MPTSAEQLDAHLIAKARALAEVEIPAGWLTTEQIWETSDRTISMQALDIKYRRMAKEGKVGIKRIRCRVSNGHMRLINHFNILTQKNKTKK